MHRPPRDDRASLGGPRNRDVHPPSTGARRGGGMPRPERYRHSDDRWRQSRHVLAAWSRGQRRNGGSRGANTVAESSFIDLTLDDSEDDMDATQTERLVQARKPSPALPSREEPRVFVPDPPPREISVPDERRRDNNKRKTSRPSMPNGAAQSSSRGGARDQTERVPPRPLSPPSPSQQTRHKRSRGRLGASSGGRGDVGRDRVIPPDLGACRVAPSMPAAVGGCSSSSRSASSWSSSGGGAAARRVVDMTLEETDADGCRVARGKKCGNEGGREDGRGGERGDRPALPPREETQQDDEIWVEGKAARAEIEEARAEMEKARADADEMRDLVKQLTSKDQIKAGHLVVFDTNWLMHNLADAKCQVSHIAGFRPDVSALIPGMVVRELDSLKKGLTGKSVMARRANHFLAAVMEKRLPNERSRRFPVVRGQGSTELYRDTGNHQTPEKLVKDYSILNCCLFFAKGISNPRQVTLFTGDLNFAVQAMSEGIKTETAPRCRLENCPIRGCPNARR